MSGLCNVLAGLEIKRPIFATRDPGSLEISSVCPHCKMPVTIHRFVAKDGYPVETAHCYAHGDVIAIRSHIHNTDWSAA